jgi:hypothetical protein
MGGCMKYAVEMGSGAMINTPSFIKISSAIQKLTTRIRHTDSIKSHKLIFIFENKKFV